MAICGSCGGPTFGTFRKEEKFDTLSGSAGFIELTYNGPTQEIVRGANTSQFYTVKPGGEHYFDARDVIGFLKQQSGGAYLFDIDTAALDDDIRAAICEAIPERC